MVIDARAGAGVVPGEKQMSAYWAKSRMTSVGVLMDGNSVQGDRALTGSESCKCQYSIRFVPKVFHQTDLTEGIPSRRSLGQQVLYIRSPDSGLVGQGVRYALVGCFVAFIYVATTTVLADVFAVPFQLALGIGFVTGVCVHFTLQRLFVWVNNAQFALGVHEQIGSLSAGCGLPICGHSHIHVAAAKCSWCAGNNCLSGDRADAHGHQLPPLSKQSLPCRGLTRLFQRLTRGKHRPSAHPPTAPSHSVSVCDCCACISGYVCIHHASGPAWWSGRWRLPVAPPPPLPRRPAPACISVRCSPRTTHSTETSPTRRRSPLGAIHREHRPERASASRLRHEPELWHPLHGRRAQSAASADRIQRIRRRIRARSLSDPT